MMQPVWFWSFLWPPISPAFFSSLAWSKCYYKAWASIDRLSDKIKCEFFQAVAVSELMYVCTIWNLPKRLEKLDGNSTKCCVLFSTNPGATALKTAAMQPLASHLTNHSSKMNKTCWPPLEQAWWVHKRCPLVDSYSWTQKCWLTSQDFQQLSAGLGCRIEHLPKALVDRDGWQERVKGISTVSTSWLLSL